MSISKLSSELILIVENKLKMSPKENVDVVISLKKDANIGKVEKEMTQKGLMVKTVIEGPVVIIAGTVPVKDISELAEISEVEKK